MKKKLTLEERLRLAQAQLNRLACLRNETQHRLDCLPRDLRRAEEEVQRLNKIRDLLPNHIRDLTSQIEMCGEYVTKLKRKLELKRKIDRLQLRIDQLDCQA